MNESFVNYAGSKDYTTSFGLKSMPHFHYCIYFHCYSLQ